MVRSRRRSCKPTTFGGKLRCSPLGHCSSSSSAVSASSAAAVPIIALISFSRSALAFWIARSALLSCSVCGLPSTVRKVPRSVRQRYGGFADRRFVYPQSRCCMTRHAILGLNCCRWLRQVHYAQGRYDGFTSAVAASCRKPLCQLSTRRAWCRSTSGEAREDLLDNTPDRADARSGSLVHLLSRTFVR